MNIHTTAWTEGPNLKVMFEREGHAASYYVIDPDARIISAENPLPVIIDIAPYFHQAIHVLLVNPPDFDVLMSEGQ